MPDVVVIESLSARKVSSTPLDCANHPYETGDIKEIWSERFRVHMTFSISGPGIDVGRNSASRAEVKCKVGYQSKEGTKR